MTVIQDFKGVVWGLVLQKKSQFYLIFDAVKTTPPKMARITAMINSSFAAATCSRHQTTAATNSAAGNEQRNPTAGLAARACCNTRSSSCNSRVITKAALKSYPATPTVLLKHCPTKQRKWNSVMNLNGKYLRIFI